MARTRCQCELRKVCDVLILVLVLLADGIFGQQIKNGDCMYDFTLPENRLLVKCGDKTAVTRFTANASGAFPTGQAARTEFKRTPRRPSFNFSSVSASTDKDLTIVQQVMYSLEDVNRTLGIVSDEVTREMEMISNAADMLFADEANLERAGPGRGPPMGNGAMRNGARRRPGAMPPLFRAALSKIQAQNKKMLQGVQEQNVAVEEAIASLKTLVRLEEDMVKSTMTLAEVLSRRVKELTAPLALLQSSGMPQSDGSGQFPQPKQAIREMFNRPSNFNRQRMPYRGPPMPQYPMQPRPQNRMPPRPQYPMPTRPGSMPPRPGSMPPNRLPRPLNSPAKTRVIKNSIPQTPSAAKPLTTEEPVTCSPVTSIGSAYMWVHQGTSQGSIMADYLDEFGRIWVMLGYGGTNQIIEYENDLAFESAEVRNTYVLPFYCEGTGHVVYGGCLYCLQSKTNHIVRYDLTSATILKEVRLVSAGVYNTYPYQFGALSDIDFAVDELGLWVIYSGSKYYGRLVISKLNPETLAIEQTWITNILKKRIGNSFMVCGVLYAINSFTDIPTFIRYTYDTKTGKGQIMNPAALPFMNTADSASTNAFTVMADYDPKERRLFTWNTGRIEIYQIM